MSVNITGTPRGRQGSPPRELSRLRAKRDCHKPMASITIGYRAFHSWQASRWNEGVFGLLNRHHLANGGSGHGAP
jgi:hypothetical protein